MNPTDQIAEFSGGTDDLSTSGLWYSHKRVAELLEAARQECRDRECTEQDVRARLADAEKALVRVRELAEDADCDHGGSPGLVSCRYCVITQGELFAALYGQP